MEEDQPVPLTADGRFELPEVVREDVIDRDSLPGTDDIRDWVIEEADNVYQRALTFENGIRARLTAAVPDGCRPAGLEHCTKTRNSLTRKIGEDAMEPGATPASAAAKINDANRFTVVAPDGSALASTVLRTTDALIEQGATVRSASNMFQPGNRYKGFHVTFEVPGSDGSRQPFEVQFHTETSYAVKKSTDRLYHVVRDSAQDIWDREDAFQESVEASNAVGAQDLLCHKGFKVGGVEVKQRKQTSPVEAYVGQHGHLPPERGAKDAVTAEPMGAETGVAGARDFTERQQGSNDKGSGVKR